MLAIILRKRMEEDYKAGMSVEDIAKNYNRTVNFVKEMLHFVLPRNDRRA